MTTSSCSGPLTWHFLLQICALAIAAPSVLKCTSIFIRQITAPSSKPSSNLPLLGTFSDTSSESWLLKWSNSTVYSYFITFISLYCKILVTWFSSYQSFSGRWKFSGSFIRWEWKTGVGVYVTYVCVKSTSFGWTIETIFKFQVALKHSFSPSKEYMSSRKCEEHWTRPRSLRTRTKFYSFLYSQHRARHKVGGNIWTTYDVNCSGTGTCQNRAGPENQEKLLFFLSSS